MMVGDNIYYRDPSSREWRQADSHHSNSDGTINTHNLEKDTKTDRVLISNEFYYFGAQAPQVPNVVLNGMGYRNCRDYRVFELSACTEFMTWLHREYGRERNLVSGDPFDFAESSKRYSVQDNKIR